MSEFPLRELTDPQALRAMAHPLRLKLLEELALHGPATATELAERVGDSAPNCSWHLRQLAKYGFVEDSPGGHGRQRPWRFVPQGNRWGSSRDSAELAHAGDAVMEVLVDREVGELRAWQAHRRSEPAVWQDAAFGNQAVTWLTAEELEAVGSEIHQIVTRHMDRITDPSQRPEGARPIRLVAWGIPATEQASGDTTDRGSL
jgi:DNA-binding transcriptional ArsR family regulator